MELKAVCKTLDKKQFKPLIELKNLPEELRISTITLTCHFDTEFYVDNIGRYVDLSANGILATKYGKNANCVRSIISKNNKTKRKKKPKKSFYNQVTVEVHTKTKEKPLNVKLFKNGSIQITGCKSFKNFVEAFVVLERELKKTKAVIDPKNPFQVIEKPFMSHSDSMALSEVLNTNIRMINSNFDIGFRVNRETLYKIMLAEDVTCSFEPCVHACVNIKYNYKNKKDISIFVFESGKIIITGANTKDHIEKAYEFITKKLYQYYHQVVVNDIDNLLQRPDVLKMLEVQ